MTRQSIYTLSIIFLTSLMLYNCTKDKGSNSADNTFCSLIEDENFEATGVIINEYLATQKNGDEEEKLNNLRDWLEINSCVTKTEILCNSCIKTLPSQSEISVDFISGGQTITMTLDISMENPLKFYGYH